MTDTFKRDLKEGKRIEYEILDLIKKDYPDAYVIEGYCKEWDIFIPSIGEGVEVKSDKMSQRTGNIVIEKSFNGKPSALSTTKASIWVFHTGKKIILTSPDILRLIIKDHNQRLVTFTAKGDTKSKEAYLVKQYLIEKTANKVIILNNFIGN
jgi:hypothetical protein